MPSLTGVSQIICTQAGKNFLDPSIVFENTTIYTYDSATGAVTVLKSDSSAWNTKTELSLKAGTYAVTNPTGRFHYRLASESYGTDHNINATTGTITLSTDDGIKIKFGLGTTYPFTASYQLERNSTATTFEKYTAPTVSTVNLGRTIYGGSVDVVNGTGTETYKHVQFTGDASESWSYNNGVAFISLDDMPEPSGHVYGTYITEGMGNDWDAYIAFGLGIYLPSTITSVTDWKTYLNNNPLDVTYELATGTDFTFTPISPTPETALGVNNFWADEGDSDVTYRADIDLLLGGN